MINTNTQYRPYYTNSIERQKNENNKIKRKKMNKSSNNINNNNSNNDNNNNQNQQILNVNFVNEIRDITMSKELKDYTKNENNQKNNNENDENKEETQKLQNEEQTLIILNHNESNDNKNDNTNNNDNSNQNKNENQKTEIEIFDDVKTTTDNEYLSLIETVSNNLNIVKNGLKNCNKNILHTQNEIENANTFINVSQILCLLCVFFVCLLGFHKKTLTDTYIYIYTS